MTHFPVLALLGGATPSRRGSARVVVEIEREIAAHEADLARVDVVGLDLSERGVVELLAERTLEVRVLDQHQWCLGVA